MPWLTKKQCSSPGCLNIAAKGKAKCPECESGFEKERNDTPERKLYDYRWQKASKRFLKLNPLCVRCYANGFTKKAEVTDHIIPHKGDIELFWDYKSNWQGLCIPCHNTKTATEDGGFGRPALSKKL